MRTAGRAVLVPFLATRGAFLLVGVLASRLMVSGLSLQKGNLVYHQPAPTFLEIWARWDAEWYLLIAAEGYDSSDHFERFAVPYERAATAGFLPLYPLMIRTLAPVFGGVGAGVLISNLALLGALVLLYRLAAAEARPGAERATGLAACAALLVYPSSLFLSAVYAESLFLLLSLATFAAARRGSFAAAGLTGGFFTGLFGNLPANPFSSGLHALLFAGITLLFFLQKLVDSFSCFFVIGLAG